MDITTTLVNNTGPSNPFIDQILSCDIDIILDIEQEVLRFCHEGVFDEVSYISHCLDKYCGELDSLVSKFLDVSFIRPEPPVPPRPQELYGRVAGLSVLDIGSGDCRRLSKCQSRDKLATDKEPIENPHMKVAKLDASDEHLFYELSKGRIVTSFNSLTQVRFRDHFYDVDGLHIVPDLNLFFSLGLSVFVDGCYLTIIGDKQYCEYLVEGDYLTEGYLGVSTFAPLSVNFYPTNKVKKMKPFSNCLEDVDYPLNLCGTPKHDGVCMMLHVSPRNKTSSVLKLRNGTSMLMECDQDMDLVLLLEKMPKLGPPEWFVLIRIVKYKGYSPFHGIVTLREFCSKVKIRFHYEDRTCLLFPPDFAKGISDGLIFRFGEKDYRFKPNLTVDVVSISSLCRKLEGDGFYIRYDKDCSVLSEYELKKIDNDWWFLFLGNRYDKVDVTNYVKILNYIKYRY
jgi:hypothetical protein